jgi:origin recognition complex subunit 2
MGRNKAAHEEEASGPAKRIAVRTKAASRRSGDKDAEEQPQKRQKRNASPTQPSDDTKESVATSEEAVQENNQVEESSPSPEPGTRRSGRPRKETAKVLANREVATPSGRKNRTEFITPQSRGVSTPSRAKVADRSARRKSARALIDRVVGDAESDDEDGDEDLEREIFESSGEDEDEGDEEKSAAEQLEPVAVEDEPQEAAPTPSKRPRGRPKGSTNARKKSPTPPRDLPPHEQYFYQNKPGSSKTSNNTLANLRLLEHAEYFSLLGEYKDPHAEEVAFLQSLHEESFPQWAFELSQGFSVCLYGYGSKRPLLQYFAQHLWSSMPEQERVSRKIVVVQGYVKTVTPREILGTIASAIDPTCKLPAGNLLAASQTVLDLLTSSSGIAELTVILHSIDAMPLRKATTQSLLARLASHSRIHLIASADTPDFALQWDSGLRSQFNFLFHDATTFVQPSTEELNVVDEVNALLGRQSRRVGGKEGVNFVLRSLTENARNLYRLLVGEVLAAMDDEGGGFGRGGQEVGVEYQMVYKKASEEFIAGNEVAFRTLLKE